MCESLIAIILISFRGAVCKLKRDVKMRKSFVVRHIGKI